MSDKYFLTDNLYLENSRFYFIDNEECKVVSNNNFSKALVNYGWEELDFMWELQLGEKYLILDCGSSGDCLFHSISEAINLKRIYANPDKIDIISLEDVSSLRKLASEGVTELVIRPDTIDNGIDPVIIREDSTKQQRRQVEN